MSKTILFVMVILISSILISNQQVPNSTLTQNDSWLDPAYLTEDFNGDGVLDTAFAIIKNSKKGILVRHGSTNDTFVFGAGENFGNGGDNFDWVINWHLVKSGPSYEVTFKEDGDIDGTRKVNLDYPSFYIGSANYGGATITWKVNKYVWVHQAE